MGVLEALRRDGIARIAPFAGVAEFVAHLAARSVYNAHVRAKASEPPLPLDRALAERRWPAFCSDMIDVVLAPGFFELALSTFGLAELYFGEFPRLYSMNAFWTQRTDGAPYKDTHAWHRDLDDRKQFVLFVLGTDVAAPEDGAHLYQRGSHEAEFGEVETIVGPAGTAFLVDTRGLHLGVPPRDRRMIAWARWGVSDPPVSYEWDRLSPVPRGSLGARYPDDPRLREGVRLVVA